MPLPARAATDVAAEPVDFAAVAGRPGAPLPVLVCAVERRLGIEYPGR
ncbi:hypothetical protein ORV05_10495 [Amycolatopsis cynarae]|uniref:Uncharacterized protein n=1 Tax=Amycolatopsis cynarae TaxID=2995223 RepID=A0ABY7B9T8_9PSEU|nr:hypothetical protein [Amycolatopsis sp. HUAS 11-8]WAL68169.1 hypothetical protein ORV05_10495 [Amycolatopsis sp. HUAS 11-8]